MSTALVQDLLISAKTLRSPIPAAVSLPVPIPFAVVERHALTEVALRAELLSRKLEAVQRSGAAPRGPESPDLERLLRRLAAQIDNLLAMNRTSSAA